MKKMLCFLLCLTLIFSSVSFCFAVDWSSSDSQNLANAASRLFYMNQSAAYYLYNIASNTNNIYNKCVDIYNTLFYGNHNISYWVNTISTWMSPIYNAIQSIPVDLTSINEGLWKPFSNGSKQAYLAILDNALANHDLPTNQTWSWSQITSTAHYNLLQNTSDYGRNGYYVFPNVGYNGQTGNFNSYWQYGTPLGNIALMLKWVSTNQATAYSETYKAAYRNYDITQNALSWSDLDSTYTFNPMSQTDGIYKWLASIQAPVARLSYVLASDERIEAQDAAAANEDAVVDNFIDSSGDGATSPSDIGSVSNLSAGYKQNFTTDASPSGIFNIFNSDHATWFSQETKNQLDTTTTSRLTKGSMSNTPLLDKQIHDIYDILGVKQP